MGVDMMNVKTEYGKQTFIECVALKDRAIKAEGKSGGFGDEKRILCASAKVTPISVRVEDGKAVFTAKAVFSALYEENGQLSSSECGAEFSSEFNDERIKIGDKVNVFYNVERTSYRTANGEVTIESYVKASGILETKKEREYLTGGEGLLTRRVTAKTYGRTNTYKNPYFVEDETEVNGVIKEVFIGDACVYATGAETGNGKITVYGGTEVSFAYETTDGKILQTRKTSDFFAEVDAPDVQSGDCAVAKVVFKGLKINVVADDEKGVSQVNYSVSSEVYAYGFSETEREIVTDCYSKDYNLALTAGYLVNQTPMPAKYLTDRVSGEAVADGVDAKNIEIVATAYSAVSGAEVTCEKGKTTLTGVAECRIIYKSEGLYYCSDAELPINQTYDMTFDGDVSFNVCVTNANVFVTDGKLYAEFVMNLAFYGEKTENIPCIAKAEVTGEKERKDCALSVFYLPSGTTLWEACKETDSCEEEIISANDGLVFPLEKDEKVLVYRPMRDY